MPTRGLGSARTWLVGRRIPVLVALLVAVLPAPVAQAQAAPRIALVPDCIRPGTATQVVILGEGWSPGQVRLLRPGQSPVGTATAGTSPARGQAGVFSFTATITADGSFDLLAAGANGRTSAVMRVQTDCPPVQLSASLSCGTGRGVLQVVGSGFSPGQDVQIDVDPFGQAETLPQVTTAARAGTFTASIDVRVFTGATVPVVATQPSGQSPAAGSKVHGVAFVKLDPCPPPTTNTTATTATTTKPIADTTTSSTVQPTTTVTTISVPPSQPPVTIPGVKALAAISPTTVRPGRCAVISISAAPAGVPVVARFADGPPVTGQTGATGLAVLSLCEPFDSGSPLGAVKVLIGIGPGPPVPVFDELRVPRRPEPPLLQTGADTRRS